MTSCRSLGQTLVPVKLDLEMITPRRHQIELQQQSIVTSSSDVILNDKRQAALTDQRYWIRTVGQSIVHLLRSNSYKTQQVEHFQHLFTSIVSHALGERFDRQTQKGSSKWSSLMCDDGSPVEIGLAYKGNNTSQHAQVRFAIEPVDDGEVRTHGTNLQAAHTLVDQLAQTGHVSSSGKHLFRRVDQAVSDCLDSIDGSAKTRTRHMIGFDLLRPEDASEPLVRVKAYFVLPGLCYSQTANEAGNPTKQLESILEPVKDVAPAPGLKQLKAYLETLPPCKRGRAIILSVDLDASSDTTPTTRVKVYWRFPDASSKSVRSHMDLGGRWGQHVNVGLTAHQAWSRLMAPMSTVHSSSYADSNKVDPYSSTGGSLFYFDLSWCSFANRFKFGKAAPSKAYVPVRHLLAPCAGSGELTDSPGELEITRRCAEMLDSTGRASAAKAYLDSLQAFCHPSAIQDNLFEPSPVAGTHTYVCAEGSSDKPDVCIYLKPLLGSP